MENFRSLSCREEKCYYGAAPPTNMQDLRSYSVNNGVSTMPSQMDNEVKVKKGKGKLGGSSSKSWSFKDPEMQRKKRVASYKAYTVEGKMKGSLKKSFRWIKEVVYGWR